MFIILIPAKYEASLILPETFAKINQKLNSSSKSKNNYQKYSNAYYFKCFSYLCRQLKNIMFMKSLGSTLKELREIHRFTLRQVEEATGISNAYLSQLENDKIAKPSANVLYKLSNIYNVELDTLLAAAGIIEKKSSSNKLLNAVALSSDSSLTKEEEEALLDYLRFIRQKQK